MMYLMGDPGVYVLLLSLLVMTRFACTSPATVGTTGPPPAVAVGTGLKTGVVTTVGGGTGVSSWRRRRDHNENVGRNDDTGGKQLFRLKKWIGDFSEDRFNLVFCINKKFSAGIQERTQVCLQLPDRCQVE